MGLERTIHLNVAQHPPAVTPSRTGHSIGTWEGDVLVVDTVGFEPGILSADGRLPHSDQLHVVERFSLGPNGRSLTRSWVAEDPLYFEGEYTGRDVVHISDVPYQQTPCEDLSYRSSSDNGGRPGWIALGSASVGVMAIALITWRLSRRRRERAA
jgi:hypothetical protein